MPSTNTVFSKSYNSFSGVDIKAVMGDKVIGELQAISYSITREKAPVYTMGDPNPRSFSRGKRGIAGTMVFIMFDRHAVLGSPEQPNSIASKLFSADKDEFRPHENLAADINSVQTAESVVSATDPAADQELTKPWYVDQILPFDVTLAGANEYGASMVMQIYGCEILNEGYGVSIDDIVSEQQCTYVCRGILPWRPKGGNAASIARSTSSGG